MHIIKYNKMSTSKNNKDNKKTNDTTLTSTDINTITTSQTKEIVDLKEQVMEMKKSEEEATHIILKQDSVICNLREEIMKLHIAFKIHVMQMQEEYNKEMGGMIFDKDMEIMHLNEDVKKLKGELLKALKGEPCVYKIEDLEEKPVKLRGAASLPSKSVPKVVKKLTTPSKTEKKTTATKTNQKQEVKTEAKIEAKTETKSEKKVVKKEPKNKSTKSETKSESKIEAQTPETSSTNTTMESTDDSKPKGKRGKKTVETKN